MMARKIVSTMPAQEGMSVPADHAIDLKSWGYMSTVQGGIE
jgi:hypothetical protein